MYGSHCFFLNSSTIHPQNHESLIHYQPGVEAILDENPMAED